MICFFNKLFFFRHFFKTLSYIIYLVIIMKRFISFKKVPSFRYQIFIKYIIIGCILFLFLNYILNKCITNSFYDMIVYNAYGINMNKSLKDFKQLFYKNIWGFYINENSQEVLEENQNLEEIILSKEEPIIYLYNTFQTEKYRCNYYSTYTVSNIIIQASFILQEYLKEYNIYSLVETASVAQILKENNILYTSSYNGSRILLEKAKENHASLKYFFDLQLSDSSQEETTVIIDDLTYAKVMIVIGTDNAHYLENQKFAQVLNSHLEAINPTLSLGISLRGGKGYQGVYNQDFSANALLIQVGGEQNTIDEVNRTLKILAKVISEVLNEEKKQS